MHAAVISTLFIQTGGLLKVQCKSGRPNITDTMQDRDVLTHRPLEVICEGSNSGSDDLE